jgi:hypothetical protein
MARGGGVPLRRRLLGIRQRPPSSGIWAESGHLLVAPLLPDRTYSHCVICATLPVPDISTQAPNFVVVDRAEPVATSETSCVVPVHLFLMSLLCPPGSYQSVTRKSRDGPWNHALRLLYTADSRSDSTTPSFALHRAPIECGHPPLQTVANVIDYIDQAFEVRFPRSAAPPLNPPLLTSPRC